jgi:hypothetical protein
MLASAFQHPDFSSVPGIVCVSLVCYRTCFGIVSFFQSGTGLTGCQTVRHSSISIYNYIDIDMDMQH